MKNYRKEYNYIIYYSDSTNESDDLQQIYAADLGEEKMKGIFKLTLGLHFPEVLFLPKIDAIQESWPPYVAYHSLASVQDICIELMLASDYIVTPCNEWAGTVKILQPEDKKPDPDNAELIYSNKSIVFFITEQDYEIYRQEAKEIAALNDLEEIIQYETVSYTRTEDLERCMIIPVFIKEQVIPYFSDRDLYEISRKRDENGTIVFTQPIGNK